MDILDHIVTILKSFDIEPKPLDQIVDSYLRRHRELASSDRRLISDVAFGVVRWRRRLDGWLWPHLTTRSEKVAPQMSFPRKRESHVNTGFPIKALGNDRLRNANILVSNRLRVSAYVAWKLPELAHRVDVVQAAQVGDLQLDKRGTEFPGGDAAWHSFPDFLYRMIAEAYGPAVASEIAESLNEPAQVVLRINSLKGSREEIAQRLAEEGIESIPTDRSPYGLILDKRINLEACACFKSGLVEVQDESSQLATIVAEPRPGDMVLDACAGAGGKSLMMAMLMQGSGRIVAADPVESKLKELQRRARRAGINIIKVVNSKTLLTSRKINDKYDMVFIDAPCSGIGTLRRNPDLKWRLSPDILSLRTQLQRSLINEYADWVRPGGRLVYATCSILPQENEEIVAPLASDGRFSKIGVKEVLDSQNICADGIVSDGGYLKIDPRSGKRDGFFAALFQRMT